MPRTIQMYTQAGQRTQGRGDIRPSARKNAQTVPMAWLMTVSTTVMTAAWSRMGRYFQTTLKSSAMGCHLPGGRNVRARCRRAAR